MKKLLVLFLVLFGFTSFSQEKKAPLSPTVTNKSELAEVSFGQPSKRGRAIFGELVPYGKVWRTGANKATEITFKKDVEFAGKKVKAGTYSLFTIPTENEWTVILNPELKQFGSYGYDKIKEKNLAEVKVPVTKLSSPEEKLQIKPSDSNLVISWDNVSVTVPLKF